MMMSAARRSKAPHIDDVLIGARIRTRRLAMGMTQEKLACAIGVTFQQVQKYETGANRMSGSRIQKIATVLECEPGQLFGENGNGDLLTRSDSRDLLEAFSRVPSGPQRTAVVALVQSLISKDEIKCAGAVAAVALAASLCLGCLIGWPHGH